MLSAYHEYLKNMGIKTGNTPEIERGMKEIEKQKKRDYSNNNDRPD